MSQFTATASQFIAPMLSYPVLVGDVSISLLARTISVNSNINPDILQSSGEDPVFGQIKGSVPRTKGDY